jgi:hypothetical protein
MAGASKTTPADGFLNTMEEGRSTFIGSVPAADTTLLFGAGNSTNYLESSEYGTGNVAAFLEFRLKHTGATAGGTERGMYLRLKLSPATSTAVTGEALRAYTNVDDVAVETAHGAHISLDFGTSGSITGLGAACRATLHVPATSGSAGTYYGGMSEIWFDAAGSTMAGYTKSAIHCFNIGGDTTNDDTVRYVFDFPNLSSGTTTATHIKTDMHASAATDGLSVCINGTQYWIMLSSSAT